MAINRRIHGSDECVLFMYCIVLCCVVLCCVVSVGTLWWAFILYEKLPVVSKVIAGLGSLVCFHLELIMELWILQAVGKTLGMGKQPVTRPLPTQDNTELRWTDIRASSENTIQDPSVWTVRDISWFRLSVQCNRKNSYIQQLIIFFYFYVGYLMTSIW
jgi:hypothetical protein